MANYKGGYTTDFQYKVNGASLTVFLIQSGRRLNTSNEYDMQYLPPKFFNNTQLITRGGCSISVRRIRKTILNLGENLELHIPLPFIGGSINHQDFLRELSNTRNINFFTLVGELHGGMVGFYASNN